MGANIVDPIYNIFLLKSLVYILHVIVTHYVISLHK